LRVWLRRLHEETHTTTVFVTHDQEEAMEVADNVVVMNKGRIEQVAGPRELYDAPANEFVMSFLGPVTTLGGRLVRPHDIDILTTPQAGAVAARVGRLQRIGFEVRVEIAGLDGAEAGTWVQLTRGQAEGLHLREGMPVWLLALPERSGVAVPA
jgi:sulfate transport system ATP-binding protein